MSEKLRFLEALDRVIGTDKRIRYQGKHPYTTIEWSFYGMSEDERPYLEVKNGGRWWPNMEVQTEKSWEVKPAKIELKPIHVWGFCDHLGESWLAKSKEYGSETSLNLPTNDLFPKNKLQKYKLIPVEDE